MKANLPSALLSTCSVYQAPEMTMLDKRSIKMENVQVRHVCVVFIALTCMMKPTWISADPCGLFGQGRSLPQASCLVLCAGWLASTI